jgi:hypothetical protein
LEEPAVKWVVTSVPTWLVAVVLIVGIPALAVGAKILLSRKVPTLGRDTHNDVAGFLVAVVAVIYAVIVGFTIVSLYEATVTANNDVSTEATMLLQIHAGNQVFGPVTSARLDADIVGYADAVVSDWSAIAQGEPSAAVTRHLNALYATLDRYVPRTAAQRDFLNTAINDVNQVSQARAARQLEASDAGSLPIVLWVGILLTSAVTLGFALVFSLESLRFACTMVGGVAVVLAVNIFMLVELGYPFLGSVAVGPQKFVEVARIVHG